MASPAQFTANRENAQHSTGPRTAEGRGRSAQNALRFGLFSTKNCVQPHETEEYEALSTALWSDLRPQNTLQEMFAAEVIRAAWRLRRCAEVESALAEKLEGDPMLHPDLHRTQTAVDRARSQSHGIIRRSLAELGRLQTEIPAPASQPEAPAKRTESAVAPTAQIGRNTPCPCRSGQKYKRCCGRFSPCQPVVAQAKPPRAA